jgi:SAM-dependent methyltransferase
MPTRSRALPSTIIRRSDPAVLWRRAIKYRSLEVEADYRRLQKLGYPVDYAGRDFGDFDLRPLLDELVPQLSVRAGTVAAFEYGTGSGAGACYLAERGFRVDAIDRSATAIAMARRFAADKGLAVNFEVGDIAHLGAWESTYDLVVDSFCLHNLISDDERQRALDQVWRLLRPEGWFAVGTSVYDPARHYGDDIRDPWTGVVYSAIEEVSDEFEDVITIDGNQYYARVRHMRARDIRAELEAAGLRVVHQKGRRGGRIVCRRGLRPELGMHR